MLGFQVFTLGFFFSLYKGIFIQLMSNTLIKHIFNLQQWELLQKSNEFQVQSICK